MGRIFLGTFVCCSKLGKLDIYNGYLLGVNSQGYITHFLSAGSKDAQELLANEHHAEVYRLSKYSFMLPTFCDLHLHAPQFLYLGSGHSLPLMEWLDKYAYQAEEMLDNDIELAGIVYQRLAQRLREHGTGAVLLFGTIKPETNVILAKAFQEKGIRAFVGKLSMDISSRPTYKEDLELAPQAVMNFIDGCTDLVTELPPHRQLIRPVITPRFIPTSSPTLLSRLGEIAKEKDIMIQSHMSESKDEVEAVLNAYKERDIDVFEKYKLLTNKTIQAHCTFIEGTDLERLAQCGTSVAHCPLSNCYFSTRSYPLREALDVGVKVGLGTDIAGGHRLDIMSAMRTAVIVAKMRENHRQEVKAKVPLTLNSGKDKSLEVNWIEALYLATTGGMIALGIIEEGNYPFQVGLPFDAQEIKLAFFNIYDIEKEMPIGDIDLFMLHDEGVTEDVVEKWWCLGDTRNRGAMYIQGHKLD